MHTSIFQRTAFFFNKLSHKNIVIFCLIQLLLFGWLDYITNDYSLIILYLFPVALTSWFVSTPSGLIFCVLSIIARVTADAMSGSVLTPYPAIHYWNILSDFVLFLITSLLFSVLKTNLDADQRRSKTDHLTGALNRTSFFEQAELELNRSRRYKRPLSVIYFDIDHLKAINDQLGQQVGDELLVSLASVLKASIRSYQSLSRFSGDEFIILMPEADEEAALSYLTKIRSQLKLTMKSQNRHVNISICALVYLTAPASTDEILRRADELMYCVKNSEKSGMLHSVME